MYSRQLCRSRVHSLARHLSSVKATSIATHEASTHCEATLKYWVKHPKTRLESGFVLSNLPTSLISLGARPPEEGDPDYDFRLKQDGEKILTSISKSLHRIEGYLQATQDLPSPPYTDFYATLGMRANYFDLIDNFSLQPRGLLGVRLGPDFENTEELHLFPVDLRFMVRQLRPEPPVLSSRPWKREPRDCSKPGAALCRRIGKNVNFKTARYADKDRNRWLLQKPSRYGYLQRIRKTLSKPTDRIRKRD